MSRSKDRDGLTPGIARALAGGDATPRSVGDHPGDRALAALVDGRLGGSQRQVIEAHLAGCGDCRELAAVAAAAADEAASLAGDGASSGAWRWPLRPAWAATGLVALLALLPALLWLRGSQGIDLAAFGVDDSELAAAGPELAAATRRLAAGRLGPVPGFDGLVLAATGTTARSSIGDRPETLLPRWSAVASTRPGFDWTAPDGTEELELLLIDADERLVGSAVFPGGTRHASYPQDLPDLEPGRLYAWRISARVCDDWLAASFVPFRVLTALERSVLARDLGAAGDDPLLRAAAFLTAGVDREGLAELAAVVHRGAAPDKVRAMVDSVLRRQRLPPELATRHAGSLIEGPPRP